MLFSSLTFLFVFLPIVFTCYFLVPSKVKNIVLLFASLVFYTWGGVSYSIILVGSIIVNYLVVRAITNSKVNRKSWLYTGVAFNLLLLVVFKYLDFFINNLNFISEQLGNELSVKELGIALPLGISFFTFQQMSMLWDVYREPTKQKILFSETALFISLFPQLVAGPIVRYHDIIDQIKSRIHRVEDIEWGIKRFIIGLFRKVVIANTCASIADEIMVLEYSNLSSGVAWLGIIAYSLQIYFDFAGYSDMAIGLGRIFGFRILENFNFPYMARSIGEFWRRWHISLSTWFRDYLYIPLGGNRRGAKRTYLNLIIVFLLTGFWHGATWSFVFWGIFHGFFLILERLGFEKLLQRLPKIVGTIYMLLVVIIAWVFFRVENISDAFIYVKQMFSFGFEGPYAFWSFVDWEKLIIMALGVLSATFIFDVVRKALDNSIKSDSIMKREIPMIGYLFLFGISILLLNSGTYNPFIYFRF